MNHPDWGASVTPFRHLLPSDRHDGISEPREYGQGLASLPSARLVSTKIHQDKVVHDHAVTIMLIAWGQILDHDITFTAETKGTVSPSTFHKDSRFLFGVLKIIAYNIFTRMYVNVINNLVYHSVPLDTLICYFASCTATSDDL